jgi:hypothetical protein
VTLHFDISSFPEMLLHPDSLKYLMTLVLIKVEGLVFYQLKILKLGFRFTFHSYFDFEPITFIYAKYTIRSVPVTSKKNFVIT